MVLTRRGLLTGIIAASCAPVIIRAESLMRIKPIHLITEAELNNLFLTVMGKDAFGNQVIERIPIQPDIMMVGTRLFSMIQSVDLGLPASEHRFPLQHSPTYPYQRLAAGISLRNRRT